MGDVNNQSNNPLQLRVNRPCALLYDESNLEVCISSPDRRESDIILTVQTANNSQADMTFTMPVGEEAGTSICMKLSDFRFEQSCNSETPEIILTAYLDLPGMIHTWSIEENGVPITGLNLGSAATTLPVTINNFDPTATYTAIHTITINGATITSEQDIQLYEIMQGFLISANHYISTSNGYDPVLVISGDMVISNNAYVVISSEMTVRFCGADSKLIIEPGSTLDLRGKLSDLNGQTWDGVRVLGNLPQIFNLIKGKFIGRQNATIENARTAIYNGAKYKLSHGGHINCKGMLFLNNRQSIVCQRYQYPNNAAIVADCDFEVNDAYPHKLKFRNFIYLGFVEGFQVKGSRFNNNMAILDADMDIDYGVGIRTWGSSLTVDQYSDPWKVVPSEFNRLGYGISAHYSFQPNDMSSFTVQHSKFNHCFVGIRNMGITGTNVLYSTFDMGALPPHAITDPVQSGICYEGAIEGFDCEENYFLNNYSGPNDIAVVGIFCDDTGESNKSIRNNVFDRMTVGNLANDVNGNDPNTSQIPNGLTYLCNTNTGIRNEDIIINNLDIDGRFDIEVAAENNLPDASFIRSIQGTNQNGVDVDAGNLFSRRFDDGITGIRNSNSNTTITYRYYDDGDNDEVTFNIPSVEGLVVPVLSLENTCEAALFIPPCCEEGVKDGFKSEYYQNKNAYAALKPAFDANPTTAGAIELSNYRAKMDRAAYKVVLHELNDTTGFNQDSLHNWIRNINTIGANLWLSRLYLADGEDAKALNTLDNIPVNFTLSTQQASDLQRYRQVAVLLAGEDPDSLSEGTLQALELYEEAGGQTEAWVKNILTFNGAHYSPEYTFGSSSAQPNENVDEENEVKSTKNMLSVSPNPAKEFVNFRISQLEEGTNGGVLEILDISGRLLQRYSPVDSDQTIKWQTEGIPGGIYFYRWSINGEYLQSGKVIVNK